MNSIKGSIAQPFFFFLSISMLHFLHVAQSGNKSTCSDELNIPRQEDGPETRYGIRAGTIPMVKAI